MIVEALLVGLFAGVVSGLFGVGGGIVFVPALIYLFSLGQVEAEATSLLAIIPVAMVGAWRQSGYGNVRVRDGLVIGVLGVLGALLGVWIANEVSEHTLRIGFGLLTLFVAFQLVRRTLTRRG